MSETDINAEIMLEFSNRYHPQGFLVRRNTGAAKFNGRLVRFGLPGMCDLTGILYGRAVEIETKSKKGKLSKDQENWRDTVIKAGGLWILARSVEGVMEEIERSLPPKMQRYIKRPVSSPCEPNRIITIYEGEIKKENISAFLSIPKSTPSI